LIGSAEIEEMMAEYAEARAERGCDPQPGEANPVWPPATTDALPKSAAPSTPLPPWFRYPFLVGQL